MHTNRKRYHVKEVAQDLKGYVLEYCEVSSIQGLSYMVNATSCIGRLWWISIFMIGIAGSCWMVYAITNKWLTTPVLVALATKEFAITEIPFPAVTICPEAKVSRSCLNYTNILKARRRNEMDAVEMTENILYDYMSAICRMENHKSYSPDESRANDFSLEEKYEADLMDHAEFFQSCKAVNLEHSYCQWMGQIRACSEIFTPILTDQGLCYSFNMYDVRDIYSDLNAMDYYLEESNRRQDWSPDTGYGEAEDLENMYPRRAFLEGAKNALVIVLLTDKEDVNYACQDFAVQGMRVTLHTASTIPRLGQIFFSVGLDRLTTVSVLPKVTETSDRIKSYRPSQRGCFFGNERELKFFKYYSQSSCNFECWTNYTLSKCGCVAFYMPRDNMTKECGIRKRFCLEDARVSYNEDVLRDRLNKRKNSPGKTTTVCNCMPLCSDISYNSEISSSEWKFNDDDEAEFDERREELSRFRASAVKVFFKHRFFLPKQREELYGTSDMISNIGGALGLFTGFALLTLAEIIYFMSIKIIDNYRRYNHWAGRKVVVVQQ